MIEVTDVHNVVGSVLDCFCPRCDGLTEHTVILATKRRVREVKCEACDFVHKYSNAKGKNQRNSVAAVVSPGRRKQSETDDMSPSGLEWEEEMNKKRFIEPVGYRLGGSYAEGTVIKHPLFGVGIVKRIVSENKIESLFKTGRKILVQKIKE